MQIEKKKGCFLDLASCFMLIRLQCPIISMGGQIHWDRLYVV